MHTQDLVDKLVENSRTLGIRTNMLELAQSYLQRSREELTSLQKWSERPKPRSIGSLAEREGRDQAEDQG